MFSYALAFSQGMGGTAGAGGKAGFGGGLNASSPTITLIQNPSAHPGGTPTTVSITLTQSLTTDSSHFLVIGVLGENTGHRISSINVGGTLVACASTSSCFKEPNTAFSYVDGGWVIGTTATAGPVVVTFTTAVLNPQVEIREYACSGGTVSADVQGTRDSSSDTTPFAGPTLTLGGTNDVIVAWADGTTIDPTSVAAPYGNFNSVNGLSFVDRMNTNSGAAASYTAASNTGGSTSAAIAMKCQ